MCVNRWLYPNWNSASHLLLALGARHKGSYFSVDVEEWVIRASGQYDSEGHWVLVITQNRKVWIVGDPLIVHWHQDIPGLFQTFSSSSYKPKSWVPRGTEVNDGQWKYKGQGIPGRETRSKKFFKKCDSVCFKGLHFVGLTALFSLRSSGLQVIDMSASVNECYGYVALVISFHQNDAI